MEQSSKKTWEEPSLENLDIESLNPFGPLMDLDGTQGS
jgi:hypothetical protein